ncbi:hypothetical protein EIN_051640 [Entamoeba invadens IP1]|uniref:hypothetical protein n=1 Tax=Entamoeba invadens IP1 TaxID=370355 RepID=UPI0002C3DD68|nr:hypothetical protein EIN_051640 [Entamoeba invadens IP1]ELP92999.1 hypothetical protein EIN_051640 [Entamoeba invadens IP1]|eukprot:XP_004259770.1 hypothetical protein EIN_051640 [Entamoeba invadens IP1]
MGQLPNSYDDAKGPVESFFYVFYFGAVSFFMSSRFTCQRNATEHSILLALFLIKSFSFSTDGITLTYDHEGCGGFFFSRLGYYISFALVSYTYYYWCKMFCENEIKVVNTFRVKIVLAVANVVTALTILAAFFLYYILSNKECHDNGTFAVTVNTWVIISENSLLAIFCIFFCIYLFVSYQHVVNHFVSLQSKQSFTVVIICSIFLTLEMCIRGAFHLYKPITGNYMNNILFISGTHFIPDTIEAIVILIIWSLDSISEAVSRHDEKYLIQQSETIILNTTSRFFDTLAEKNRDTFTKLMANDEVTIKDADYRKSHQFSNSAIIEDSNQSIL